MLVKIINPIETKNGFLPVGEIVDVPETILKKLGNSVQMLLGNSQSPEPQWQSNFCQACGHFNNWRGCCPLSIDDCLLSRIMDCEGDVEKLKGLSIGQGVKTDDVLQLWIESGELIDNLFKKPVWLFCIAEHLRKGHKHV